MNPTADESRDIMRQILADNARNECELITAVHYLFAILDGDNEETAKANARKWLEAKYGNNYAEKSRIAAIEARVLARLAELDEDNFPAEIDVA